MAWDQHISRHTGLLHTYALRLAMLQLGEANLLCGFYRPTMILYGIDNIRDLFGHKVGEHLLILSCA